jgi:glutathione S-transferase
MVCEEKGIAYELIDAPPHSPPVNAIHPFGKLPVMRHDGFTAVRIKSDCNLYRPWLPGPAVNAV